MLHRRHRTGYILLVLLVISLLLPTAVRGADTPASRTARPLPVTKHGQKWRVAYVESYPYSNYASTLYGLIRGLEKMGWVQHVADLPYTPGTAATASMWHWLAGRDVGPYIEFVGNADYDLADMGRTGADQIIHRLAQTGDIDLVVAMGTDAGKAVANGRHHVPTLVFSASNAVAAGIIQSEADSGLEHVWAHVDSQRYARQLRIFYETFHFKRLGVVYANTRTGRSYAAIDEMESLAKSQGFEIVRRFVPDPVYGDEADAKRHFAELKSAYQQLATQVDAMYSTSGYYLGQLPELMAPFYAHRVPVFSQQGIAEVRAGTLLTISQASFDGIGQFGAVTIARVLRGERPRSLPQTYWDTPAISWNLAVADRIGYRPSFQALLAADTIFTTIETPKE